MLIENKTTDLQPVIGLLPQPVYWYFAQDT